ncbi:response regulator transcription factor [Ferruginibacter sp. HRS2-29]|uniref:response regulator n=1 Tax=Ferruginibacter sp. HRS2-29 TaxID=2487334 RepID=UPI0020CFBDB3|nr:response regulator transcription factor [Ferruginibacter sp. HRS2-29]MCP9753517.1 DNA-binding response regulator [Ferruginibacter sp. HRS2-29]
MINVLIFEDNSSLRATLELLIATDKEFQLIGSYPHCDQVKEILSGDVLPDVILMDIDMPGKGGIEGVKMAKEELPDVQIIMFTVFEDDNKIFDCMKYGANGYILKKDSHTRILDAIRDVYQGGNPLSPEISRKVIGFFKEEKLNDSYLLTPRELNLLTILSHGSTYKELAAELGITVETVKSHLKNIYTKMHVACGTEAVAKGLRLKIIR